MQPSQPGDTAMRREIRSTLKAYAFASYDTVLGNWRYRQGGSMNPMEATRLQELYTEEYAQRGGEAAPAADHPWWRFW